MTKETEQQLARQPHRVRLSGFLIEGEGWMGLGDAIKGVPYTMGMKPCGGSWMHGQPYQLMSRRVWR